MLKSYAIRYLCFVILLILIPKQETLAHANDGIRFYIEKDFVSISESGFDFLKKETELKRLLKLSLSNFTKYDTTSSKIYKELSLINQKERKFEDALEFRLQQIDILEHFQNKKSLATGYTAVGELYHSLSEHYKAEDYFLKGLVVKKELFDHSYFENYTGLCHAYFEQGKYSLLKKYAQYALDIAKTPEQNIDALNYFIHAHVKMGDLKKSYELCVKMIDIAKENNLKFRLGRAFANMGWIKMLKGKYAESIDFYKEGIQLIEKSDDINKNFSLSFNNTNLSNVYMRLSRRDKKVSDAVKSFNYAEKALQKAKLYYGEDYNPNMGSIYQNIASKYIKIKKDRIEALNFTQEAVKCYMKNSDLENVEESIAKGDLYRVNQKWRLLVAMKEKAYAYAHLYLESKDKSDLLIAEKHIRNAVDMIDIMRAEMSDNETKIFWRKETRSIYNVGVELSEWLGDKEKVFYYLEKSKSILLLDELNHKEVSALIPPALIERERELLDDYVKSKKDSHFFFSKYTAFVDSLGSVYPSYYKYKFDTEPPTIREIQKNLLDDSTHLVQYYVTSDSLYTLNITKNDVELLTQKKQEKSELENDIKRFLSFVNNKDSLEFQKQYVDFLELSNKLYKQLFADIKHKKANSIIVGDGLIGYIPFDALVKDLSGDHPKYLIEDHFFSFASSVSILQKKKKKAKEDFHSLLIVCPEEFSSKELQPLRQSKQEVKSLSRIVKSTVLGKNDATLENFKQASSDFHVIHFSSHSGMEPESKKPWIAFQDSIISLDEIYKLHLNASLVTLSSCKSFDGDFQSGEGINSLARAFLFADASAVVGSLWNLNEVSGFEILEEFYKNLKSDYSKPKALRKAKLKFIKKNPYKSPYHWASLVCIGNPEKLSVKAPLKTQWIIPLLLLFSFLSFKFYSSFQKKES